MKRRIMGFLLALTVITGVLFAPVTARAETFDKGIITGESVAFRDAADKSGGLIRRLPRGTVVEILETNVNAEWHRVRIGGKQGYVNRMYVSLDPSLAAYKRDYSGEVVNCKECVNVREAADSSSKLLGTADKGRTFDVTAANCADGWHRIVYEGQTAYIHGDYLRLTAKASDSQLTSLMVRGGTVAPSFSPDEYGYVVRADSDTVTISATANSGVKIDVNETGKSTASVSMPSHGSKTVRIAVGGKVRYTLYIVRGALVVGTWNIKRGNGNLPLQGRLIENQQPDIMALQEVYRSTGGKSRVDNLASLRTKDMQNMSFATALTYSGGGAYGVGLLSRYEMSKPEVVKLDSGSHEQRVLQRVVVTVDGKKVSLYNTHFSFNSAAIRKKQFAAVLRAMNADDNAYRILFGDFNAGASEFSQLSGYRVVNTRETKYLDYAGRTISKNEIDNIIVSDNITVLNSRMIENDYSDHKPLIAYLLLD